jgi:hypothetical protein
VWDGANCVVLDCIGLGANCVKLEGIFLEGKLYGDGLYKFGRQIEWNWTVLLWGQSVLNSTV